MEGERQTSSACPSPRKVFVSHPSSLGRRVEFIKVESTAQRVLHLRTPGGGEECVSFCVGAILHAVGAHVYKYGSVGPEGNANAIPPWLLFLW